MIIDGKKIRDEIRDDLKKKVESMKTKPRLAVVYVGSYSVIDSFVLHKKKFGEYVGVGVDILRFPADIIEEKLAAEVEKMSKIGTYTAIIIQLPLPEHINTQHVLDLVPAHMDADVLSRTATEAYEEGSSPIMPPVAAACAEVAKRTELKLAGKNMVIIGYGRLVGKPVEVWAKRAGTDVEIVVEDTPNKQELLKSADVIISGAGSPHMIKPEMIKDGVVLFDAGTSEQKGEIVGDIDPACSDKASVFMPVPGGVGPLTVAMLFANVATLSQK